MKTVHKYTLDIGKEVNEIELPSLATFLHCAMREGTPTLWFLVDTDMPSQKRTFRVIGTGWEIPEDLSKHLLYLGTVMYGVFVWHIFEENDLGLECHIDNLQTLINK